MAYVYWVRLPEHADIKSEGYVGVFKGQDIKQRRS